MNIVNAFENTVQQIGGAVHHGVEEAAKKTAMFARKVEANLKQGVADYKTNKSYNARNPFR